MALLSRPRLASMALFLLAAVTAFAGGRTFQQKAVLRRESVADSIRFTLPDSARLAEMGLESGRQLVAYVLVSSKCGFCQNRDTKRAIAAIRDTLRRWHGTEYSRIAVVGVAADATPMDGVGYLRDVGLDRFDEISSGLGWANDALIDLVWRSGTTELLVPQVVVVSRPLSSSLNPLMLRFGQDTVLRVIRGRTDLIHWVGSHTQLPAQGEPILTSGPS